MPVCLHLALRSSRSLRCISRRKQTQKALEPDSTQVQNTTQMAHIMWKEESDRTWGKWLLTAHVLSMASDT